MADTLPSDLAKVDPADAWQPWRPSASVPWNRKWVAHLYRRAAFGPSPSDTDRALADGFGQPEIDRLAELEATTKHDVKAVEYLVRERLHALGLDHIAELTHFAATSEDINNLSYALTVSAAVNRVWLPKFRAVVAELRAQALQYRDDAMLARTHGQPATPTTMGKELAVFVHRLERIRKQVVTEVEQMRREALAEAAADVVTIANAEGLTAHANSILQRGL